jgi:hypothetical protein
MNTRCIGSFGCLFASMFLSGLLAGCDYEGDWLFPLTGEIDDVYILTGADGGPIVPADVETPEDILANTIYAEVGPSLTTEYGGVTVEFVGTGGPVCIWVDPETAYWNQAVSERADGDSLKWTFPDNVFDDGDIDLFAGLSVYYTGSPGETVGDFEVSYEDSLGNEIPISLAACPNTLGLDEDPAAAGRGAPEFCTIPQTDPGISYTVLLQTWSTPLDDDRLGYGFLLVNGDCEDLRSSGQSASSLRDECLIQGESIVPQGTSYGPFYGFDELNNEGRVWERSIEFESTFCDLSTRMRNFCNNELDILEERGEECERKEYPTQDNRCFCGDENDTPSGGAL